MKRILIFILLLFTATGCSSTNLSPEPLTEEDFTISYQSFVINEETTVDDIENALGFGRDFEDNNYGYISSGIDYSRRWQAVYPNHDEQELRIIFLTTSSDETYLVFVDISQLGTRRGIRPGDTVETLIEKYGEPDSIFHPHDNHLETYRYYLEEKFIDFVLDSLEEVIKYIHVDYRSYRADKDQIFEEFD